jgi:hypothetical protein
MNLSTQIDVRVQWNSGDSKIIHTYPGSPIDETLASHGFSTSSSDILFVAFKGEFINAIFSFHYYNISTGDKLVCHSKKKRLNFPGVNYFLNQTLITPSAHPQICTKDEIRTQVHSKMTDQAFDKMEFCDKFISVMNDFLIEQDNFENFDGIENGDFEDDLEDDFEDDLMSTVIPQTSSINGEPMPTIWSMSTPPFTDIYT